MCSLRSLPCLLAVMACGSTWAQDRSLLFDPAWIEEQVVEHGIDFVIQAYPANLGESEERVHQALDLSRHVLRRHPEQTRRQLQARLVAYSDDPNLAKFQELPTDEGVQLRSIWPSFDQAGGPLVRMIDPIGSNVDFIAITADAERIVAGSTSDIAELYDAQMGRYSGSVIHESAGSSRSTWSFPQDCRLGLQVNGNNCLALWDIENEVLLFEYDAQSEQYQQSLGAISGDGSRALSVAFDFTNERPPVVQVWDLQAGEKEGELGPLVGTPVSLELSHDGRVGVTTSQSSIEVWDIDSRERRHIFTGSERDIPMVTVARNEDQATAFWSDAVRVYDLEEGEVLAEWPHGREFRQSFIFSDNRRIDATGDGHIIATAAILEGKEIQVWDSENHVLLNEIAGKFGTGGLAIADDGYTVVTASGALPDARINIWDTRREDLHLPDLPAGDSVAMAPNGEQFALDAVDGAITIFQCESGEPQSTIDAPDAIIEKMTFSRDSQLLFIQVGTLPFSSEGATITAWNVATGNQVHSFTPSEGVHLLQATATGDVVCTNSEHQLEIWNPATGTRIRQLDAEFDPAATVEHETTPDASRVVSINEDGKVIVTNLESGRVIREFTLGAPVETPFTGSCVSNSTLIAEHIESDGELYVWDLDSGKKSQTLIGHEYSVGNIATTANGQYAISLSRHECELRLWDVEAGECLSVEWLDESVSSSESIIIDERCERILVDPAGPRVHLFDVENLPTEDGEAD